MNKMLIGALALSLMAGTAAMAQSGGYGHDDHPGQSANVQHRGWAQDRGDSYKWKRGQRMGYNDWAHAQPVDYRVNHLRRPPHGYEWRQSNGQYVLGAVATGLIASAIINSGHR